MIHFNETWVLIPNIRRFQPQYQSSWNFFFCSWWFLYLPWRIVRCQYYYCREGMKSEKHRAHRPIWRTFYVADQSSQFKPVEPRLIYYIKCRAEWWAERLRIICCAFLSQHIMLFKWTNGGERRQFLWPIDSFFFLPVSCICKWPMCQYRFDVNCLNF